MGLSSARVLALIPARSGSKGIPHKNIMSFGGKPLLAHSIAHALAAHHVSRVIVSTDSEFYAQLAREYGAEVPFLRPADIAGDRATDLEVFQHALGFLAESEGYRPEICAHLRPTYPIRPTGLIDEALEILQQTPGTDSVRTIAPAAQTPFKMWFRKGDGLLEPCIDNGGRETWNLPRQDLPRVWIQNACVDVVWTRVILEQGSMTGRRVYGLQMAGNLDIDDLADLERARGDSSLPIRGRRVVFDIDGVIASLSPGNDYAEALPLEANIKIVNAVADAGATVVLFTARGSATGINWEQKTREQLERWGVRYHELLFGKPPADYYVDDRSVSLESLARSILGEENSSEHGAAARQTRKARSPEGQ